MIFQPVYTIVFSGVKYRIMNGDEPHPSQGRVEVSLGGVWGTVCDAYFDAPEAAVFCRSLGFTDGEVGKNPGSIYLQY